MIVGNDDKNKIGVFKVKAKLREEELKEIAYTDYLCRKSYKAAFLNILTFIFCLSSIFVIGFNKMSNIVCYPMLITLTMAIIGILLIIFDLKAVDKKEESYNLRPKWVSILFLVYVAAAIGNAISYIIFAVVTNGFGSYLTDYWPGGILAYCIVPIMVLLVFFFFEIRIAYTFTDCLIAFAIIIAVYVISFIFSEGLKMTGPVYDTYYTFPYIIITVFICILSVALVYFINQSMINVDEKKRHNISDVSGRFKNNKYQTGVFSVERNRQILYLIFNCVILGFSIRTVITNFGDLQRGTWLSNPNMICMVLIVISVITIIFNIRSIKANSTGVYPEWYKYISFMRVGGASINFFSAIFAVVLAKQSFWDLFAVRWGADGWVFVLCPILAAIIFFMEAREYDLKTSFLAMIPYPVILILTKIGIELLGQTERLSFEVANFYGGYLVIVTMIAELCAGIIFYVINLVFIDNMRFKSKNIVVIRNENNTVELNVCGARSGVAPTSSDYYEYGQASNCFVMRDGSYGMIIDCGCGMVFAADKLKGCKNLDIFLSNTNFSTIMGLLAVPNPCPGAKIRIFGPFGRGKNFVNMNGFAIPPLWPVNVIVGECISATPNKAIRLNNLYSVQFTPVAENASSYMIHIFGAVNVCYTGALGNAKVTEKEWAKECDILIYDGRESFAEGCSLAEQANAGHLLFANYRIFDNDKKLAEEEMEAKKISRVEMSFAKQGTLYQII